MPLDLSGDWNDRAFILAILKLVPDEGRERLFQAPSDRPLIGCDSAFILPILGPLQESINEGT